MLCSHLVLEPSRAGWIRPGLLLLSTKSCLSRISNEGPYLDENIEASASEEEQSQEQAEVGQWHVLFAATLRWWCFTLNLATFPFQLERKICGVLPCSTTDKTQLWIL